MRPLAVFLIFFFLSFAQCYTTFIHLLGMTLNSNIIKKYAASNAIDCGTQCALTTNCTGFQLLYGTGQCNLLTMMRSYNLNASQCGFYLKQSGNVTVSGQTLTSNIDKALQNAMYDSQLRCPDGWNAMSNYYFTKKCVLTVSKSICNNYASFLKATVSSAGDCVFTLRTASYSCPDSTFTLGNYTDGKYCLKVIPRWSNDTDIGGMTLYDYATQYCYSQTGGYLVSIHSAAENTAINTLQKKTTSTGVMIGLFTDSSSVTAVSDLRWLDGTSMSYTNYATLTAGKFTYSVMTTTGQWQIQYDPEGSIFQYIACKRYATTTLK